MGKRNIYPAMRNALIFALMVYAGILTQYKVIMAPWVMTQYGVSILGAGLAIICAMAGYWTAFFISDKLIEPYGTRTALMGGLAFITLGSLAMLAARGFIILLPALFIIHMGIGCVEVIAGELSPSPYHDKKIAVNFIGIRGAFYGFGMVVGAIAGGTMLARGLSLNVLYIVAQPVSIIFLVWAILLNYKSFSPRRISMRFFTSDCRIWYLALGAGLIETLAWGVGAWLVLFFTSEYGMASDPSILYLGAYLVAALLGRVCGILVAEKAGYIRVTAFGACAAAVMVIASVSLGKTYFFVLLLSGMFSAMASPATRMMAAMEFDRGLTTAMKMVTGFSGIVCVVLNLLVMLISSVNFSAGFYVLGFSGALGVVFIMMFKRNSMVFCNVNWEVWESVRTKRADRMVKLRRDFIKWEEARTRPLEDDIIAINDFTQKALSRKNDEQVDKPDEIFHWARIKAEDANKKDLDELDATWIKTIAAEKAEAKRVAKENARREKALSRAQKKRAPQNTGSQVTSALKSNGPAAVNPIKSTAIILARYPYLHNGKVSYDTKIEINRMQKEPLNWKAAEMEVIAANKRRMDELDAAIARAIQATQSRIDVLEAALARAQQETMINGEAGKAAKKG